MRKTIIYILGFILICFLIPIIFTHRNEIKEVMQVDIQVENNDGGTQISTETKTVNLLHTGTGEVETLNLDQYLYRCGFCRNASKF